MADVSAAFLVFDVLFNTPCLRKGAALDGKKRFPIGSLAGKGTGKDFLQMLLEPNLVGIFGTTGIQFLDGRADCMEVQNRHFSGMKSLPSIVFLQYSGNNLHSFTAELDGRLLAINNRNVT